MKLRKKEDEKKVKFTICVNPMIYQKMEDEMIKKSRLIERLLKEYYEKKGL